MVSRAFAFLLVLMAGVPGALAQPWPAKPIRVVVPFGAGSATDIVPRIVLEKVSAQLGQPIVIENRPGAGSTTGTALVARAEADGYTLLATSSAHTVAPALYDKLTYDPAGDLAGITILGGLPNVLIVGPDAPYRTLDAFVAAAKAKPGSFNFASVGVGSGTHFAAERLRMSAGFQAAHVPFKSGSEALTEIMAGRVQFYMCPAGTAAPFIRDGRVRALAAGTPTRIAALPDIPTSLELGYKESDYVAWVGLLAPAKTPKAVIERLHKEVELALEDPKVAEKLGPNGVERVRIAPTAFDAQIGQELKANAALAKALGLKAG